MEGATRDFGQAVDLCTRIRDILAAYPDGSSILKELLQNADDAGASEFKLLLDLRTHGTDSLAFEGTAPFQGPAIYAYNDAIFTDTDLGARERAER
jgi:sacsin